MKIGFLLLFFFGQMTSKLVCYDMNMYRCQWNRLTGVYLQYDCRLMRRDEFRGA